MSYDLMVFEPEAAPAEHKAFMAWYAAQTEWSEGHNYADPVVTTPTLQAWFNDIIETFPPMNGPMSPDGREDDPRLTDHCIGRVVIYSAFAWSQVEEAYQTTKFLAEKHRLGFFDVSGEDSKVYLPQTDGSWGLAHSNNHSATDNNPEVVAKSQIQRLWAKLFKQNK